MADNPFLVSNPGDYNVQDLPEWVETLRQVYLLDGTNRTVHLKHMENLVSLYLNAYLHLPIGQKLKYNYEGFEFEMQLGSETPSMDMPLTVHYHVELCEGSQNQYQAGSFKIQSLSECVDHLSQMKIGQCTVLKFDPLGRVLYLYCHQD